VGGGVMSRGPQTFKESEAARLVRAVKAAGLAVRAVEVDLKSGKITVRTGDAAAAGDMPMSLNDDLDRELAEFESRNGQG
jgi:hypothetical protein